MGPDTYFGWGFLSDEVIAQADGGGAGNPGEPSDYNGAPDASCHASGNSDMEESRCSLGLREKTPTRDILTVKNQSFKDGLGSEA